MKLVRMTIPISCCFDCPYHSGGTGLGSPLYCGYFTTPRQVFDSNGRNDHYEDNRDIATFCPLPENTTHIYQGKA